MPKSTLVRIPFPTATRRLVPYSRRAAQTQPRRWSPIVLREPSTPSDIFVRALMVEDTHKPEGEEAELNIRLELCLFVDIIPGKEEGCFVDPDTYILTLAIWSPLPVPCRPMVTAQLDRFVGIDRDIPIAPLWAAEVHGTRTSPLKFFRTAHWVRGQVELILSLPIAMLPPDTFRAFSSLVEEITVLIAFFQRSQLSRSLRTNSPPRPRPLRRQLRSSDVGSVSERLGAMKMEDTSDELVELGPAKLDV